tara:strand:+ start:46 stop:228 length:183 start_codon:yes stop_codon:yes gene_type:complete
VNKLSVSFKQKIIETTMVDLGCKGLLSLYSQAKAIRVKMVVVVSGSGSSSSSRTTGVLQS